MEVGLVGSAVTKRFETYFLAYDRAWVFALNSSLGGKIGVPLTLPWGEG